MSYFDILAAKAGAGGGTPTPPPVLIEKSVTQNGTYSAEDDEADGYSAVAVNVPNTYAAGDEGKVVQNGSLVSQTSTSVSQNGTINTTTNDSVTVSVPNTYTAQDEGKVVSNGALVAQGSDTVTQNGTVDTTLISSLLVNVAGGGGGTVVKLTLLPLYTNVTANEFYIFEDETYIYCCGYLAGNFKGYYNIGFSVPQDFDINKIGTEYLSAYNDFSYTGPITNIVVDKTNRTIEFKPGSTSGPRIAMIAFNKATS